MQTVAYYYFLDTNFKSLNIFYCAINEAGV